MSIRFLRGQYLLMESIHSQHSQVQVRQQVPQLLSAAIKSSARYLIRSQLAERVAVAVLFTQRTTGSHLSRPMEVHQDIAALLMTVTLLVLVPLESNKA